MKNKLDAPGSSWDIPKWIVVIALIVAGIVANYTFREFAWSLRLAGWILLVCVAAGVALTTAKGRVVLKFGKEARIELRKVVWPNRQETTQSTVFVMSMVVATALLLWGVDSILMWGVSHLTG